MGLIKRLYNRAQTKKYFKRYKSKLAAHTEISEVEIDEYVNIAHHAQVARSSIGRGTSIGRYSKITDSIIGKYCSISWDVTIGAIMHPTSSISTHAFSYKKQFGLVNVDKSLEHKETVIGNDVWIGCNSVIMPGVRIGNGAIIGAGAVVTHDISEYEVVGGIPARHIRWRFSKDVRTKLNSIKWWDFPDNVIKENIYLFNPDNDIERDRDVLSALEKIKKRVTNML